MEEDIKKSDLYKGAVALLLMVILSIMAITIAGLKEQLNTLQQKTDQQSISQQSQIDGLSLNIETVRNEMQAGFENQQKQLEQQQEQLNTQKNIQSNTLKAFIRFQKQQTEQADEFREELKKD